LKGHAVTPRDQLLPVTSVPASSAASISRLVKRFGESALVSAGFISLVVGYVILGPCRDIPMLILVSTIRHGNGVLRPTLSSLVRKTPVPPSGRLA
jgi:hypothetical protein